MERRALLAVVLSFVVLYAYQAFFLPPPPRPDNAAPAAPAAAQAPAGNVGGARPPSEPVVAAAAAPEAAMVVGESTEREIVVETPVVRAVFTNRGARLISWRLKEYDDAQGEPVDMVTQDLPPGEALPFTLQADDDSLTARLNAALYRASEQGGPDGTELRFEFEDESGLSAEKVFHLDPSTYLLTARVAVRRGGQPVSSSIEWGAGPGDLVMATGGSFFGDRSSLPPNAIFHTGEDVERIAVGSVAETPEHRGSFRFVGVEDHYFITAIVNPGEIEVAYRGLRLPVADAPGETRELLSYRVVSAGDTELRYYIGPKAFDVLQAVDGEFVRAINFGFWAWLAVPFLSALQWIYGYLGNYGWAIIALTILMNIVIFPLRHKTVVSMRKMQELQPQLKVIQERYAGLKVTDPARQKMNTEMMNLYREKGVNPASGCIPMVLQFPLLFAFYALLSEAIELRGAPFVLWIQDLSRHDPLYVTPLLMGVTMFWQQKLTPTTGDATQQKVMMIMPFVFVAMFLTLPSGLAIYYFVNTLWAIGQQVVTNKVIGPAPAHVVRPAAERRVKPAGGGQTPKAEKNSRRVQ
ncbi:MAG: membrane protein insertase YidC [Acidimicrobiia bacterium]|nr:membrane protein insertase YidC [Acidimicrobiia bacterium]